MSANSASRRAFRSEHNQGSGRRLGAVVPEVALNFVRGIVEERGVFRAERCPVSRGVGKILADSPAFDWTCQELERETDLDRLEARGTVRIALKSAGLEAGSVLPDQMKVVIERVLPGELIARGVNSADGLCARMATRVMAIESGGVAESPDEVFRRLGGS